MTGSVTDLGDMEVESDLTACQLDVYDSKEGGVWHPDHGALMEPEGWEFLPSGDAFITRRVKAAGVYWLLWRPRDRNHRHRRLLGIIAPADMIARAGQRPRRHRRSARVDESKERRTEPIGRTHIGRS